MMYEYAVSPALFDSEGRLAFLYEAFGIERGRLISEYPHRKWEQIARAVIARNAKDEYQSRVWKEALIALCKRALYPRPGSHWIEGQTWTANAIAEHTRAGRRGFHGLLVEGVCSLHPDAVEIGISLAGHPCWPCPGTLYVDRTAPKIVEAVAPLLDLSATVILIDRHFNPGDGSFVNVLSTIARHLLSNGAIRPVSQIKYVASNIKVSMEYLAEQCRLLLPSALPAGIEVRFLVLPKELLHDRFVLTNLGAAQFGQGLDEAGLREGNGQVLVTRLGEGPFGTLSAKWKAWNNRNAVTKNLVFSVSGTG